MSACAVALALLLDASASVPPPQWNTLAEGHAAAFEAAQVRRAVRASGPVAVRAWEFSDVPRPLTPWRVLASDADAHAYAREHLVTPDGFVLRVDDWRDVPRAIIRKISLELAGAANVR